MYINFLLLLLLFVAWPLQGSKHFFHFFIKDVCMHWLKSQCWTKSDGRVATTSAVHTFFPHL
jgi:hypothetical protein